VQSCAVSKSLINPVTNPKLDYSHSIHLTILSLHITGGTEENHQNFSVRIVGVLAEILTEHFPRTDVYRNVCMICYMNGSG
jgi:hypothetical protein